MYAVIEDSGSQFKVSKDDIIRVDLRERDAGGWLIGVHDGRGRA